MESPGHDLAVFGSAPAALLLAGCLAAQHGKRVVLVGEPHSRLRLPAQLHLSVGPTTRPDTWCLLAKLESEAATLLTAAGADPALSRTPIGLHADLQPARETLGHVRHLAIAYGLRTEFSRDGNTLLVNDVAAVSEAILVPLLDAWLTRLGVQRLSAPDTKLSVLKNGSVVLATGDQLITARNAILADDGALLSRLSTSERPPSWRTIESSATLTSAAQPITPPILRQLDRGVTLSRQNGAMLVHVIGADHADERLGASLAAYLPLQRAAVRKFRQIVTPDGAAAIGWLKAPKLFVMAGMGESAIFFVPALARFVAGSPTPEEKKWFAARDASSDRSSIAEFAPGVLA